MPPSVTEGEKLFHLGKIDQAREVFAETIRNDPEDVAALNNLGVIAVQQSRILEAAEYFARALQVDRFDLTALVNYGYLLRTMGCLNLGVGILEPAAERYPDNKEITTLLREARRATSQCGPAETEPTEGLPHAEGTTTADTAAEPGISPKIAIVCLPGMESFLSDIVEHLRSRYEVRICYSASTPEIVKTVDWADIVWIEWANELAVELSNKMPLLENRKVICRLHSYEAFADFPARIQWRRIDDLVFVGDNIKKHLVALHPEVAKVVRRMHVIPNGVNLREFPFKERSAGKHLAYVGYVNHKKGPMLLLHAFAELARRDAGYRLSLAGRFQDDRYRLYFEQMGRELNLTRKIRFDGWVDDIPTWLEDKQYIICSSLLESQGMAILEAMACGLKPVIHNFVGARNVYDSRYLWNSIGDFIEVVTSPDYESREYRQFVQERYSLQRQLEQIDGLILKVCQELNAERRERNQ